MTTAHVGAHEFALDVVEKLRAAGFESLWAGGCVRDLLMGNSPSDYDVATSATPDDVRKLFGHRRTLAVGAAFGVIVVLPEKLGSQPVEVATFRTDSSYSDGRRPDAVVFSTAENDAMRRDFTINGMFYDPIQERVIDHVGGQEDLDLKVIRAIGNAHERIAEDKLRMLRAVRFAARFGFAIEPKTHAAIHRHASELSVVSGERMAVELKKTLESDRASWAVQTWEELGLFPVLLPEFAISSAKLTDENALELLDSVAVKRWDARFVALAFRFCESQGAEGPRIKNLTLGLKHRLKFSNDECRGIEFAVSSQRLLEKSSSSPWSVVQPLMIHPDIALSVELLKARAAVHEVRRDVIAWIVERLDWTKQKLNPAPLLTGQDLIAAGLRPGPRFRELLQELRDKQLDSEIVTHEDAITWMRNKVC